MILADSNIVIYTTSGKYSQLTNWFLDNTPAISAVTLVEVLGYHRLSSAQKQELENFFSRLTVLYPSEEVFQIALQLRQQRSYPLEMP